METNSGVFHKPGARTLLALIIGLSISGTAGCFGGSTESLDSLTDDSKSDTVDEGETDSEDDAEDSTDDDTPAAEEPEDTVTTNAKVSLFINSPVLESGPDGEVKIFAYARDAESNAVLVGEEIRFSTSDGMLSVGSVTTNTMGYAETTLMSPYEYKSVNAVTITASHANCTATSEASCSATTQDLEIVGATLSITPKSEQIPAGDAVIFDTSLVDGAENAISNQWIGLFESCNATSYIVRAQTNDQGVAQLETDAPVADGDYSYCAKAIYSNNEWEITKSSRAITVTSDLILEFSNADADGNYSQAISDTQSAANSLEVQLELKNGTTSTSGDTLTVTSPLGAISATGTSWSNSATITVSNDAATFYIHSAQAGTANLTVEYENLLTKSTEVRFYSDTPAALKLNASLSTVSQNESTTVRALVKDDEGVLVKDATVIFSVVQDITAGQLRDYSVVTNKDGVASTTYIAGNNTTGTSVPVQIKAIIEGNPAIEDIANINVEPIHTTIVIGTGNKLEELTSTQFQKDFVVQIKDNGVPVANSEVELLLYPTKYYKGHVVAVDTTGDGELNAWGWDNRETVANSSSANVILVCQSEDSDKNGYANYSATAVSNGDGSGDIWNDPNNDGELTPGTTALTLSSGSITTDENGFGYFTLTYPQNYAWWIEIEIEARTNRNGIQASDSLKYYTGLIASQLNDIESDPANRSSPFGTEVYASSLAAIGSDELIGSPSICQPLW